MVSRADDAENAALRPAILRGALFVARPHRVQIRIWPFAAFGKAVEGENFGDGRQLGGKGCPLDPAPTLPVADVMRDHKGGRAGGEHSTAQRRQIRCINDRRVARLPIIDAVVAVLERVPLEAGKGDKTPLLIGGAESIATVTAATYAENITLWEENTNLQRKLCVHKEHLNAITAQQNQLQLQTTAQAFTLNAQTIGHGGHNNTLQNKWGG